MAKREKKPKIYRIKLYDTLEEELKSIREEAKIKEEMHRNWDNPEYWKKVYENFWQEPFPYPEETDVMKIRKILRKKFEEVFEKK
ncbi:MAG: hypothetical protein RQ990_05880 [Candidatus Hydrothermia bacterium]|jgi:hypothetical protein|nr:hypothetical protein [Candidatus Hydrothermia bacterium]